MKITRLHDRVSVALFGREIGATKHDRSSILAMMNRLSPKEPHQVIAALVEVNSHWALSEDLSGLALVDPDTTTFVTGSDAQIEPLPEPCLLRRDILERCDAIIP